MKTIHKIILAAVVWSQLGFAQSHIVLFKQTEIAVSTLEHSAFQNLLQTTNGKSVEQLKSWLGARNLERASVSDLWLVRGAKLELSVEHATKLAKEPWVQGVYVDKYRKFIHPVGNVIVGNNPKELEATVDPQWALNRIGIPKLRAEFPELNGQGIRVGILDTGIQSKHAELPGADKTVFKDFINGIGNAYDDNGHGTHVAGTIAGKTLGIAPQASIIFAKVFGAAGAANDSDLLAAMQWMFDPDGNPTTADYAQIVSNSWGADLGTELFHDMTQFTPYVQAVQAWIHGGIVPVFAAGNSGFAPNGMPGGLPDVIAVAALSPRAEAIAEFSSRGPNIWKIGESLITVLKPDITAPGENIVSAYPGNKFAILSGTSMATPHVSGAIALLLQANKKLKVADVKTALLKSSEVKIDTTYGFGIMDAHKLIKVGLGR